MEKRKNARLLVRNILMIIAGSAIFSLGFDLFLEPAGINCGGVSGIAMLIVRKDTVFHRQPAVIDIDRTAIQ